MTAYFRDTTKWIVGGIVATAGAVIAGSSLTNIGSLDPSADLVRLGLAVGGALLGFVALGLLFARALDVFYVPSVALLTVADATPKSEWAPLLEEVKKEFPQLTAPGARTLKERVATAGSEDLLLESVEAMLPYLHVRRKFQTMRCWLPWTVLGAAVGFGLFAWAANPPEPPKPPSQPPAAAFY